MRILSWNINGIRTLPLYHPWNTLKTGDAILKELNADIICFQEMKSSRAALERHVALPSAYDSFFSFPQAKGGYSGVAIYTSAHAVPLKAEEGLSGSVQPKPPFGPDERISAYPRAHELEDRLAPDEQGNTPSDLGTLDLEGRALTVDFGLFVLINVYCPNETSDARLPYKLNFHLMLEERVRLLCAAGREVIVLGDINISATPNDHCDGHLPSKRDTWWEHPARKWFRRWLEPEGPMIDIVRNFWPEREGMYTCWNTKISARETNYGTRIDYVLITPGLVPWIKHGDIQPSLKGSDHCPVYVDLHDEITTEDGRVLNLRHEMGLLADNSRKEPPRLASKFWDEYSGKQRLLSSFFGKGKETTPLASAFTLTPTPTPLTPSEHDEPAQFSNQCPPSSPRSDVLMAPSKTEADVEDVTASQTASPSITALPSNEVIETSSSMSQSSSQSSAKRKLTMGSPPRALSSSGATPAKKRKAQTGKPDQTKLSTFFAKPSKSSDKRVEPENAAAPITIDSDAVELIVIDNDEDADYRLALQLSQEVDSRPASQATRPASSTSTKAAWTGLFAKQEAPTCIVHGEPAKLLTVNKTGPNKGRGFFVCSRPVGPGYDRGRAERLREEVDHKYKCDFFKWASDVKRDATRTGSSARGVTMSS